MKFLHTADWHLGRYLHGRSLIEDQAHVLAQLVELARVEAVDAVVVAGDIYDRAIPPAEAVELLDEVLARLVVDAGIAVIVIAGNHDSPERIGFGARIGERQGLVLRGPLGNFAPFVLADRHGEVAFHPLPYADPTFARALPGGEAVRDHQGALDLALARLREGFVAGRRNVLIGHAFVAGGAESESERPLTVGGAGMVRADSFAGFDFVALGHLHRPQSVGGERVHYAGSLLKYSFNEVAHRKSVSLVELGATGELSLRRVELSPLRDLRILTGSLAELLAAAPGSEDAGHYLRADLTDPTPPLDPMARLREVYPHLLELRFASTPGSARAGSGAARDHRQRAPEELFAAFFREMTGEALDEASRAAFAGALDGLRDDPREEAA